MSAHATTPAERLVEAREHLSLAFECLECTDSYLAELERNSALDLRADVGETIRRLGNLIAFTERGISR
jgi:hypothetical protein